MNLLLIPVVAPVIITPFLFLGSPRWRRFLVLLYTLSLFAAAAYLLAGSGVLDETLLGSDYLADSGLSLLTFTLHPYGRIAAFGFTLVGAFGLLYGLKLTTASEQAVSIWAVASAVGVSFAGNYLTFLLFWEMLSLAAAALVYLKKTPHSIRMAARLLAFQLVGGFALTVGIVLQYSATGSLALAAPVAASLPFFIVGIGVKTAFIPLHLWVPWGYPAASFPCSVLLAALCTKAGVYGVARILPPTEGIALMGALMAIVGVSIALIQGDLRRLLSYHIISQVGYMVAGVGLGFCSTVAVDGGLLHVVNHMIYKALLFMSAGAVILATGTEKISELRHPQKEDEGSPLWKVIPVAAIGAVVGALSIAGMPPFNGYVSKYLLKNGTHDFPLIYWVLQVASVGTALSFAKFVYLAFIKGKLKVKNPLNISMQVAITGMAACCVIFGLFPGLLKPILPHQSDLQVYTTSGVLMAAGLVGGGILLFALFSGYLERENTLQERLSGALRRAGLAAAAPAVFLGRSAYRAGLALAGYTGAALDFFYRNSFKLLQKLDYRPGESGPFLTINFSNIDFDVVLVILIFGIILVALFSVQFGLQAFLG